MLLALMPCGNEPAREDGGPFDTDTSWPTAIASKLAPTGLSFPTG